LKLNIHLCAAAFAAGLFFCTPNAFAQITLMPLGDSITKGAGDSGSGYRDELYTDLSKAGVKFQFVGATTANAFPMLTAAHQEHHNGYGTYRTDDLTSNLAGVHQPGGWADDNRGGYWLTGGHGTGRNAVTPDIVLLLAGTNDVTQGASVEVMETRMTSLLDWFKTNRPATKVFVATVIPFDDFRKQTNDYSGKLRDFNAWLTKTIPVNYPKTGFVVDLFPLFLDNHGDLKTSSSPDGIYLQDGIHPSHNGYVAIGDAWFSAIKPLLKP
jgi:hypothetical protein